MKNNFNVVRQIRMQLKTGFLKKPPPEYTFLRRYPPMLRDRTPPFHDVSFKQIPYVKLYEKAVQRNPLYADEKVYGGYWNQEPQALTLAKKQHEFMQQGLSEEDAYLKACDFVSDIESKSYEALKGLLELIKSKSVATQDMVDAAIVSEVEAWQAKLAEVEYSDLTTSDKGELDFFIQTKILRWNEVERERRMKEPLFAYRFEKLREQLFPDAAAIANELKKSDHNAMKANYYKNMNIGDSALLSSTVPFYYEDYVKFFNKVKASPHLNKWELADREEFSNWIIATLAYKHTLDSKDTNAVQEYLKELRNLFFPMIRSPQLAQKCVVPSIDEFKTILYENEIGYKKDGASGQLYVKRFYRIPMVLFPQESFHTFICSDVNTLKHVLASDDNLMNKMIEYGVVPEGTPTTSSIFTHIKHDLVEFGKKHPLIAGQANVHNEEDFDDDSSSSSSDSSDSLDSVLESPDAFDVNGRLKFVPGPRSANVATDEEWNKLVRKYAKRPTNTLEKEMEEYHVARNGGQSITLEDCRCEADLMMLQRQR